MLFERQRNGVEPEPRKMSDVNKKNYFWGHEISAECIGAIKSRTEAIGKIEQPRSLKDLRSFLGLARNIRKHVNNFAIIAGPLHDLVAQLTKSDKTNKNMVIDSSCWTKVCEDSFVELKHTLMDT